MSEEKNTSVEEELIEAENDTASKKSISKAVVDLISIIATSIVAIMVVFTFLFRIVGVSGPSMMDTLRDGDWLIVSAFITEPERG
ncbi:MAG: hypothetical protein IIW48_03855, partial [Clostridia bacterium]|nr:hypothetical protein [Clostridia bacterium]